LIQVVLSATLLCLYYVLGDFHMPTDTLVQTFFTSFLISTLVPLPLNLHMKSQVRSG